MHRSIKIVAGLIILFLCYGCSLFEETDARRNQQKSDPNTFQPISDSASTKQAFAELGDAINLVDDKMEAMEIRVSNQHGQIQLFSFGVIILVFVSVLSVWISFVLLKDYFRKKFYQMRHIPQQAAPLTSDAQLFSKLNQIHYGHKDLLGEIKSINLQMETLKNELLELKKVSLKLSLAQNSPQTTIPEPKPEPVETLYFGLPDKEQMSFDPGRAKLTIEPGRAFYKLDVIGEKGEVDLVDNHESIKTTLNNVSSYIEVICESENEPNAGTKRVHTIEKGKVELIDGLWKVLQKVKIRYE
jgi:hypothetical protein